MIAKLPRWGRWLWVACLSAALAAPIAAQTCGTANLQIRLTAPTTTAQRCAAGTSSAVSGSGPFTVTCTAGANVVQCATRAHWHDLDGSGTVVATTDGVMLNRVMLGLTGTAVSSAAQAGSPRTTWSQIATYLNAHCGYSLTGGCLANGQTYSIAPQTSVQNCINAILPLQGTACCSGTFQVIVFDSPIGSNSCSATCGPPIGGAAPDTPPDSN